MVFMEIYTKTERLLLSVTETQMDLSQTSLGKNNHERTLIRKTQ